MLKLTNTSTRQKESLHPLKEGKITLYTCGPTVYNFAHIGNFRTYVFEDILRRTLKFYGYEVEQVMNLTDVDDKTIRGANQKGVSLDAFTQPFKEAFFEDLKTLNIEPAEHYPQATDFIPHMISMIEVLLEKGIAYRGSDGSVYFAIQKFPRYGCLSHLDLSELRVGASDRVASDEYDKESASDFVIWKALDPERDGDIYWESPFGKGRPGWHLECSAMAMSILGDTVDIHVGGVDNLFPHHENEIAQSECTSGKQFVKHWMHSEHLIVDGKKMSKSFGNFYTLRDLLDKGYSGKEIRYMLLHTHYKTQLNFTLEGLASARSSLARFQDFILRLSEVKGGATGRLDTSLETAMTKFKESLGDDLNISLALASLFDLIREVNGLIDEKAIGESDANKVIDTLKQMNAVLGVLDFNTQEAPAHLQAYLDERQSARQTKNWALSDQLRDKIQAEGWVIEDTAQGARLKKL